MQHRPGEERNARRFGRRARPVVEDNRQQRATTLLVDVAYVIEAHFEMTAQGRRRRTPAKHIAMFNRRAATGQCFHRPCLGTREIPGGLRAAPDGAPLPESRLPADQRNRDLGWMLYDIDFADDRTSRFFRARLADGVLDIQRCLAEGDAA